MRCLTQEYAEERAKIIVSKTVSYDLTLNLREGNEYDGSVLIVFEVVKLKKSNLYIEYSGRSVKSLQINK